MFLHVIFPFLRIVDEKCKVNHGPTPKLIHIHIYIHIYIYNYIPQNLFIIVLVRA